MRNGRPWGIEIENAKEERVDPTAGNDLILSLDYNIQLFAQQEALKVMEKSDFVASVLGEHAFEYFLRNKRQEWEEYRKQVTPFELKKYLPKL